MIAIYMLTLSFIQLCSNLVYLTMPQIPIFSFIASKYFFVNIISRLFLRGNFIFDYKLFIRSGLILVAEYYQIIGINGLTMLDISMHFSILPFLTNFLHSWKLIYLIPIMISLFCIKKTSFMLLLCCLSYSLSEILLSDCKNYSPQDQIYTSSVLLALIPAPLVMNYYTIAASINNIIALDFFMIIFSKFSIPNILPWRVLDILLSFVYNVIFS